MRLIPLVQEVALLAVEIDFYSPFPEEKSAIEYLEGLVNSDIQSNELEAILLEIKYYWGSFILLFKQNLRLI